MDQFFKQLKNVVAMPRSSIVSNGGADSEPKKGKDGGEGSREKQQKPKLYSQASVPGETEMKKVFDKFDENKDGKIGVDELGRFMKKFGISKTQKELENIIKTVDEDSDGTIDFPEFYSLYTTLAESDSKKSSKKSDAEEEDNALRNAFKVFDKDNSGSITALELQLVLKSMGMTEGSSLKKCQQMIKRVDSDNDGVVNFEEFKNMMNSDIFKS